MSGLVTLTLIDNPLLDKDAVVLQLQRQLPMLQLDGLPALGFSKPVPASGQEALQLISSWQGDDAATPITTGEGATIAAAVNNPPQIAVVAGAGPSWLVQQDLSRSLAQFLQQAMHQPQQGPAAQQQPDRSLLGLVAGNAVTQGTSHLTQVAAVGQVGNSLAVEPGVSALYPPGWLTGQVPAAISPSAGAFPWQHMHPMQPPTSHPVLQQMPQAGSSSSPSLGHQHLQQSALVQQIAQHLQATHIGDVRAHPLAGFPASSVAFDSFPSNAASVAQSGSQMGSLAGTYLSSEDSGSNSGARSSGGAAGQMSNARGPSSSGGAPSNTGSFIARVKSYLEVATSTATSAASSKSMQGLGTEQQQANTSGLHRSVSHGPLEQLLAPLSTDILQLHGQAGCLQLSNSAAITLPVPTAAATTPSVPQLDTPEAACSAAAAAAHDHTSSNSTAGGAAMSEHDADDVCSAGGVESCGSEDSGSEVLVQVGNISNAGADLGSSPAVAGHDLTPSSYACLPQHVRELAGQGAHAIEVSRCPSSSSSMAGTAGGSLGLELPGANPVVTEGDAAADSDGSSQVSGRGADSGTKARSPSSQQCLPQQQPSAAHAATPAAGAGTSQPRGHREGDRSFTNVLESAWWGRRRR